MESPSGILIIANPTSGRGRHADLLERVVHHLRQADAAVDVIHTHARGDAEGIARAVVSDPSRRPRCIAVSGGDGTIQETVNGVVELAERLGDDAPTIGIIPAGRCNDLAHALNLPTDPRALADLLMNPRATAIDLGYVNGRYFCTVATMGFDAAVSRYVDRMRMPLTGTIAYLYGAAVTLLRYRPTEVKLTGDFGSHEGRVFLASTANTATYGGAIPIAPGASPTDGLFHLCIIGHVRVAARLPMLLRATRGTHVRHPLVRLLTTRSVRIETPTPQQIWADGEHVADTPATLEVRRGLIRVHA